jgi:hypothetical protein
MGALYETASEQSSQPPRSNIQLRRGDTPHRRLHEIAFIKHHTGFF